MAIEFYKEQQQTFLYKIVSMAVLAVLIALWTFSVSPSQVGFAPLS